MLCDLYKFILLVGSPVGTQTRLQGLVGGRAAPFPGLYSSIFWGGSDHHRRTKESRAPCVAGLWIILPLLLLPFPGESVMGGDACHGARNAECCDRPCNELSLSFPTVKWERWSRLLTSQGCYKERTVPARRINLQRMSPASVLAGLGAVGGPGEGLLSWC